MRWQGGVLTLEAYKQEVRDIRAQALQKLRDPDADGACEAVLHYRDGMDLPIHPLSGKSPRYLPIPGTFRSL